MVCRRSQSQKSGPKARSCWHNCHPFLNTGGQCVLWHSGELWSRVRLVVPRSSPIHSAYQSDTFRCKVNFYQNVKLFPTLHLYLISISISIIHPAYQSDTLCWKVTTIAIFVFTSCVEWETFAIKVSPTLPTARWIFFGYFWLFDYLTIRLFDHCLPTRHPLLQGEH